LLLCENPLPPIDEAIAAAQAELPRGNYYTEPYSGPLRRLIAQQLGVPERMIHINAGSELILRQLFDRFGQQVHLLAPTYGLFPETPGAIPKRACCRSRARHRSLARDAWPRSVSE
jgi:histidinol-phosphate aminotransferase